MGMAKDLLPYSWPLAGWQNLEHSYQRSVCLICNQLDAVMSKEVEGPHWSSVRTWSRAETMWILPLGCHVAICCMHA